MNTDLLATLKSLLRNHKDHFPHDATVCPVCRDVEEAIASAELELVYEHKEHEGGAL